MDSKDTTQPFSPSTAKRLARRALGSGGRVFYTKHALAEAASDDMTRGDINNVLRGGVYHEAEHENGQWRHRVETARMAVVVTFAEDDDVLIVVTCWRR